MDLVHPIVNLIHGRRLYYFMLQCAGDESEGLEEIKAILNRVLAHTKNSYDECACTYALFGRIDFILRIWITEESAFDINDCCEKSRILSVDDCFLCSRMSPWYQRKIEKTSDWHQPLSQMSLSKTSRCVSKVLRNDIPKNFLLFEKDSIQSDASDEEPIRLFITIEEDSVSSSFAYQIIDRAISSGSEIDHLNNISYYSIYSLVDGRRFLLIKGEAMHFRDGVRAVTFITDYLNNKRKESDPDAQALSTTTFISYADFWLSDPPPVSNPDTMGTLLSTSIQNLALTVEVSRVTDEKYDNDSKSAKSSFRTLFGLLFQNSSIYASFFWYHPEEWWRTIARLRRIYQLVLQRKNDDLKGIVIGDYIYFEKQLRQSIIRLSESPLVQKLYPKIAENKDLHGATLGVISTLMCKCLKGQKVSALLTSDQVQLVSDFAKLNIAWIEERNALIHGKVTILFRATESFSESIEDDDSRLAKHLDSDIYYHLWENFLITYFKVRALLPRILKISDLIASKG